MNNQTLAILGVASAVVTIASFVPYIYSIFQHKTKPERAAWWIWSLLMVITLALQYKQGSTWSLLLTGTYLAGNIVISVLSINYGYGSFGLKDKLSILATLFGILLWYFTDNPTLSLLVIISIDFIGNILVYRKTWMAPETENLLAWCLNFTGALLGVLSVGSLSSAKVIFPLYVTFATSIIIAIIMFRRRQSDTMH